MIRLRTLGSVELRAPDDRVLGAVLAQPKRVALLAYLAAARPTGFHRRDRLLALFWSELDEPRARDALNQALRFLRNSLGSDVLTTRGADEVGVDAERVWCDAVAFRAAVDRGQPGEALELYHGDFLDGFFAEEASGFAEWVEGERAALRELGARGARQLAELHDGQGAHTVAVRWGRKAVDLAPDDERAFRRLLGLLERAGDRAGAFQAYDDFAHQLRAEYGAVPAAETRAIIDAMRQASGMPAVAVDTPPETRVLSPDIHPVRRHAEAAVFDSLAPGASLANGRYIIEGVLGVGGMATVYRARDVRHERCVAVKILQPGIAAAIGKKALLREIRIAASLQHPHIVSLFDSGESNGQVFYVMPYVMGESLRARLRRDSAMPIDEALRIARDVADALAHAHGRGVVHRDIKPDNVLLSGDPTTGELHALVADFGVAKAFDESRTHVEGAGDTSLAGLVGTPGYMAPEQASGGRVDHRVDVYAWGILAYELLAGEHPFATHAGPAQLVAAHISEQPEHIASRRADTPVWLAKLVTQCVSKSPEARPANGGALLAAITHAVPRTQSEASSPERRRVSVSRYRMVAAFALIALIATGLWFSPALLNNQREPAERSTPVGTSDPTRMAVLYFDDLSDGKTLGTLAAGLTEDLIDKLSAVRALHVISPNGVRPLRGAALMPDSIGRRLNVGTIVGGSVTSSEGRLRVVVRLIDAASGQQLQSRTFERPFGELFALQDDLSTQVSTLLRGESQAEVWVLETSKTARAQAGTGSAR